MLRRLAIFTALLAAVHASQLAGSQTVNDTLQYTEKFLRSKIGYHMMHISDNMKAAVSGALKHRAATEKQQVGREVASFTKRNLSKLPCSGWDGACLHQHKVACSCQHQAHGAFSAGGSMFPPEHVA